jgi:hypothetical protein
MAAHAWTCPACAATATTVVHEQPGIPVNSMLLLPDGAEARDFPVGSMRLVFCDACGFCFNGDFDPALAEYSERYEASQAYSPRFNEFATGLAQRWIDKHDIHGKTVMEIGCDKGDFLALMCELGGNRGIGIDPAADPSRQSESSAADRMEFIADFYDTRYSHLQADVIICRHTLEHIKPVAEWVTGIREAIGDQPDTLVLFELPDIARVLEEVAFWDIYYEHCSYFSLGSLARLFRRCGFEVLHLETDYDDQYLLIECRPSTTPGAGEPLAAEDDLPRLRSAVEAYRERYAKAIATWRDEIGDRVAAGQRVVIWGGGSKGVSYILALELGEAVRYAVDINPHKQGKHLAGSGVLVIPPERLQEIRPDLVILMNPIYVDEIRADLERLGVPAEVVAV